MAGLANGRLWPIAAIVATLVMSRFAPPRATPKKVDTLSFKCDIAGHEAAATKPPEEDRTWRS